MAKPFIEQLTHEHVLIVDALNEANRLGISTIEGQQKLVTAKNILLTHLKKEDGELYPTLARAGLKDSKLQALIAGFQDDMKGVSQVAIEFFAKYEHGGSGFAFARDFGQMMAALSSRIRREEGRLYPAYDAALKIAT